MPKSLRAKKGFHCHYTVCLLPYNTAVTESFSHVHKHTPKLHIGTSLRSCILASVLHYEAQSVLDGLFILLI